MKSHLQNLKRIGTVMRLVFWNSIHLEVASDSFCFLINSSWLLVFIFIFFSLNFIIHVFIRSLYYFLLKRNAFSGIRLLKDFICKILPKEMRIMNPFPTLSWFLDLEPIFYLSFGKFLALEMKYIGMRFLENKRK